MTETGKRILDLMTNNGKSASEITHSIKVLGNGSMQRGLTYIGEYFKEEIADASSKGLTKGRMQGVAGTALALSIGGLSYFVIRRKKKAKLHEEAGQKILKTMESSINKEDPAIDTENAAAPDNKNI